MEDRRKESVHEQEGTCRRQEVRLAQGQLREMRSRWRSKRERGGGGGGGGRARADLLERVEGAVKIVDNVFSRLYPYR
jgi:hypothetical protein